MVGLPLFDDNPVRLAGAVYATREVHTASLISQETAYSCTEPSE